MVAVNILGRTKNIQATGIMVIMLFYKQIGNRLMQCFASNRMPTSR
jgi:hypothetical protein